MRSLSTLAFFAVLLSTAANAKPTNGNARMIKRGPAPPQPLPFPIFKKRETGSGTSNVQQPQAIGAVQKQQITPKTPKQTPEPFTKEQMSKPLDGSIKQASGGDPTIVGTSGQPQTNYKITDLVQSSYDNKPFIEFKSASQAFMRGEYKSITASVNSSVDTEPDLIGVKILDSRVFQEMEGLGAGLSDSSAMVLQAVKKNKPDVYWDILHLLYCTSEKWLARGSVGMNIVRIPIGSSDFSLKRYTHADTADGSADLDLKRFDIDIAPIKWEVLKDIVSVNPKVEVTCTPWTPPPWMKTGEGNAGGYDGGSLQERFEEVYSRYLVKFVQGVVDKGFKVRHISLQEGPRNTNGNIPSSPMKEEQQARLGKLTRKALDASGLQSVKIQTLEASWDTAQYAIDVLDKAADAFDGANWQCYAGKPSEQQKFIQAYPNRTNWMNECTRITQYYDEPWVNTKKNFGAIIDDSISNGVSGIVLWNVALQYETENLYTFPNLPNTCRNCLAPLLISEEATGTKNYTGANMDAVKSLPESPTHQAMRRRQVAQGPPPTALENQKGLYSRTSDFLTLAHLGRAVRPRKAGESWGKRVGIESTEDGPMLYSRASVQAFRTDNVDEAGSSRFTVILLQKNDHAQTGRYSPSTFQIEFRNTFVNLTLPVGVHTFSWIVEKDDPHY